jgi:hypothetical protein
MFSKITYIVRHSRLSLWGARLAGGWLVLSAFALVLDIVLGQCSSSGCDIFFYLIATIPGIPLFAGIMLLLNLVLGQVLWTEAFIQILVSICAFMTLYILGAAAQRLYYR